MDDKKLTFLELYNDITGQAWSMFDSEVEDKDEFESAVTTSIQKALANLWCSYNFPFRKKNILIKTRAGVKSYSQPEGVIAEEKIKGVKKHCVICNSNYLEKLTDKSIIDEEAGEPQYFYIENNELCFYPVPDKFYNISVDYYTIMPCCDEEGETKDTLEENGDYIDIPDIYRGVFKRTLMPLAMTYIITSETDENYSGYLKQYEDAYKILVETCYGVKFEKRIVVR